MPDDTHIDLQQTVAALRQDLGATRAEQHGGSIQVDSTASEFTEFTIRLPRSRPARATSTEGLRSSV